jgi:hypothetical protein
MPRSIKSLEVRTGVRRNEACFINGRFESIKIPGDNQLVRGSQWNHKGDPLVTLQGPQIKCRLDWTGESQAAKAGADGKASKHPLIRELAHEGEGRGCSTFRRQMSTFLCSGTLDEHLILVDLPAQTLGLSRLELQGLKLCDIPVIGMVSSRLSSILAKISDIGDHCGASG